MRIEEHKTKDSEKMSQQKFTRSQKTMEPLHLNKSEITDNAGRENHVIDWEGTCLAARENQTQSKRTWEAIWIKRTSQQYEQR